MSILDDVKLDGKVAIVTGAGRGIGQETALALAEGGARVVVGDIDMDPANETVEKIKAIGGQAVAVAGNVTAKADVDALIKAALDNFGSLEIMANVAGITRDGMIHKMSEEQWQFIIDVNLKGTYLCCQGAVGAMRDLAKAEGDKKKARKIINFSSVAGLYGNKGQANYSAAKAGIVGLTKTVAIEGLIFNIQCNAVAPGWIDTRLTAAKKEGDKFGIPDKDRQQTLMYMNFMGIRAGVPQDISRVVYFLSCDLSNYFTGMCLNVSGGLKT